MVSGLQQMHRGGFGSHAGGKSESRLSALEPGNGFLQHLPGGVGRARVVVAPGLAHILKGKGGGLVNRRD